MSCQWKAVLRVAMVLEEHRQALLSSPPPLPLPGGRGGERAPQDRAAALL